MHRSCEWITSPLRLQRVLVELSKRMAEIDIRINAHHVQRGCGPVPQAHSSVQRGHEVLPHLPQAAPQGCRDGRLRRLASVCACGHPQQKGLGQDSCPRSCPTCPSSGKILASCQDLALLGKNLAQFAESWRRSCPLLVRGWELTVEGWGTVAKMELVQIATVVAIVMVLWYQSSPNQYYWYYALPLVCLSYMWVQRSAFRAAWQRMATNRVLLLKGTVHLVGVVVGLEALVMSFFYREVLSAVLVLWLSPSFSQSLGCTNTNSV